MKTKPPNSKKGASKFSKSKPKGLTNFPSWVWLLVGLVIGFSGAFFSGLTLQTTKPTTAESTTTQQHHDQTQQINQPVFDFYTLLPEAQIQLPGQLLPPDTVKKTRSTSSTETTTNKKVTDNTSTLETPVKYLLQAGAFRSIHDANRLKAQLLLQGLNPKIETVTVGGGETWHRVQLGPFQNSSSLDQTRKTLTHLNIDSLILQLK